LSSKIVFRIVQALGKDAPYIAGLIDGEGGIAININHRTPGIDFVASVILGMTHKETIKRMAEVIGTKMSYEKRKLPAKPLYKVRIFKQADIEQILLELIPYLITKRRQAELVLEFIKLKRQGDAKTLKKQFNIYLQIRKLNPRSESVWRSKMDYTKLYKDVLRTQEYRRKYGKQWKVQLAKDIELRLVKNNTIYIARN